MSDTLPVRLLQSCSAVLLMLFTLPLLLAGQGSMGQLLMQVLPLLMLLPQLHLAKRRPLQWLGFLVLFYFTHGVLQLFTPDPLQRALGAGTVLCCFILFVTAIVRLRQIGQPAE
jgi:uncharacterized membrane protein